MIYLIALICAPFAIIAGALIAVAVYDPRTQAQGLHRNPRGPRLFRNNDQGLRRDRQGKENRKRTEKNQDHEPRKKQTGQS